MAAAPPTLLDHARTVCRRLQYSVHTETAYVRWVVRVVRFQSTRHPRTMGTDHVRGALRNGLLTLLRLTPGATVRQGRTCGGGGSEIGSSAARHFSGRS